MNLRRAFVCGFRGAVALAVAILVAPFSIVRSFVVHDSKPQH